MKLIKNKKGYTIADIPWVAIILGVAIITMSILSQIVRDTRDTQKTEYTTSVTNESVTISSGTGTLSQDGDLFISSSACRNSSMNTMGDPWCNVSSIGAVSVSTGVNLSNFSDDLAYVDYTHYTTTTHYNITIKGNVGQKKIADWLPTIGLVLGAVIIITVLGMLFTMKMRRE